MDNKTAPNGSAQRVVDLAKRDRLDYFAEGGRNKRSVWTVTTQPYAAAHFATFPPKLIEPCILAGSPPKCCGECGAPWERISKTVIDEDRPPARQNIVAPEVTKAGQGTNSQGSSTWGHWTKTETLGWRSTCSHDDDSGSPVVLDPFAGAGTTGVVALRHNRSFIGLELNAEYCELARNRIRDDAPLFNAQSEAPQHTPEAVAPTERNQ